MIRIALILAVLVLAAPASAARVDAFYWSSDQASVTLDDSDWATNHAIASATCYGRGASQPDVLGDPTFAQFRCALRNARFALVAHVTLTPTSPDAFVLTALTGRPKHCH